MDENMKAFLMFGKNDQISKKQAVDFFVLSLLFIGPIGFIGERKVSFFLISLILMGVSVTLLARVWKKEKSEFISFGYRGGQSLLMMISFALIGCRVLIIVSDKSAGMLVLALLGIYLVIFLFYLRMIRRLINKGAYLDGAKANTGNIRLIASLFGVFGIFMAKLLAGGMDNDSALKMIALCCFLLSILSLLGIPNLYKYMVLWKANKAEE